MQRYVAFLRAVNVGGAGKLPMESLRAMCIDAGFASPRTYIASGNVVFGSDKAEQLIKAKLETQLAQHAGKSVGVIVRSAAEIADVVRRNPFPEQPKNRVMVLFSDTALPNDPFEDALGVAHEQVALGRRELFIHYPDGQADSSMGSSTGRSASAPSRRLKREGSRFIS